MIDPAFPHDSLEPIEPWLTPKMKKETLDYKRLRDKAILEIIGERDFDDEYSLRIERWRKLFDRAWRTGYIACEESDS